MKPTHLLAATAAFLAAGACNAEQAGNNGSTSNAPIEAVAPPEGGDWSQMVTRTPEGGYLMGNPDADVKLVEFGSMTCSHCADFAETAFDPLVDNYVKTGRVSYEFRNYVRDPLDITMSLIARCGEPSSFFPLTDALFASQGEIFETVQAAPAERQQAISQLPPAQQFTGFAELAGLQQWAAQRGVPAARLQQCLTNQAEIDRLVGMTSDAATQYSIPGTPSFLINGELVAVEPGAPVWTQVEAKIRESL